jgi:hypothetical protein
MHVAAPQSQASLLIFSSLAPTITECWAVCVCMAEHMLRATKTRVPFSCASRASVLHSINQAAFLVTALQPKPNACVQPEGGGLHLLMFSHCMKLNGTPHMHACVCAPAPVVMSDIRAPPATPAVPSHTDD